MYQNGNNHQSQQPDSNHPNQEGFASDLTVDDYSRRYQKESARNGMPEGKMSDVKDGKMMSKPPVVGRLGVTHILFMCFAFLALAGIVAYLFLGGETNTPLKDTSPIAAENLTTVYFYPTTECSADELSEMTKTIAERIQVLGTAYDVSSDEKKIILKIDKTLLGNTAVERKHTVDLIASRGDLLIHANNFGSTAKLSGADIETVEVVNFDLRTFLADNVNNLEGNRYEQLEVMGADEVYGIKIIVKAESGEKCRAVLKEAAENNGKMAILHNSPSEEYPSYEFVANVVPGGTETELYIVGPGSSFRKNSELIMKLLKGEMLNTSFLAEIADPPTWETDETKFGKGQVDHLDGKNIVVEWHPDYYTKEYTAEIEYENVKKAVKERMDAFGTPYMFGVKGFDEKIFCLKFSPEAIGPDFVRLIFGKESVTVNSPFRTLESAYGLEIVDVNGAGQYGLLVETFVDRQTLIGTYDFSSTEAHNYVKPDDAIESGTGEDKPVYLVVNDVTVAESNLAMMPDDNHILFTNFLCLSKDNASVEDMDFLNLVKAIYDSSTYSYTAGTFKFRLFDGDEETENFEMSSLPWKYPYRTAVDAEIMGIIESFGHSAEKIYDSRNMLIITVNVDASDGFARNFTEEVKKIYTACNFDDGSYNKIYFVIKDETKESPADKCRIEFEKNGYDRQGMYVYVKVAGPKFVKYLGDFYDITNSDEFFSSRNY